MNISLYMINPGYFPTLFAVTSLSIASFMSRVGAIFAPFAAEFPIKTSIIIFMMLQILAIVSTLFLIDDYRHKLPSEDSESPEAEKNETTAQRDQS